MTKAKALVYFTMMMVLAFSLGYWNSIIVSFTGRIISCVIMGIFGFIFRLLYERMING